MEGLNNSEPMKPLEDLQIEGCLLCIGEGCAVSALSIPWEPILRA